MLPASEDDGSGSSEWKALGGKETPKQKRQSPCRANKQNSKRFRISMRGISCLRGRRYSFHSVVVKFRIYFSANENDGEDEGNREPVSYILHESPKHQPGPWKLLYRKPVEIAAKRSLHAFDEVDEEPEVSDQNENWRVDRYEVGNGDHRGRIEQQLVKARCKNVPQPKCVDLAHFQAPFRE
jgi:hypothetical protein